MPVAADDRLAVLPSQSGDPDVVLWNRPAFLAELIPHLRVRLGCRLIDPQDEGFSDKGLQKTLEVDAEARAEQPVPVLTDDDYGQMMALVPGQHLAKSGITGQKSGDSVGIEDHRHSSGSIRSSSSATTASIVSTSSRRA